MNLTPVFLVVAIVAVLPSVPVHAQSDAPKVERPVWPPPGSTWTVNLKLSGSLGSGVREATFESLGEVDWHGRRVMGNYMRGGAHAYFDAERRIVASVRDGKPIQTYHPYEALYDWPLFAGKSWPSEFQLKIYDRNQTLDLKYAFTVEAFEEVTTPAGIPGITMVSISTLSNCDIGVVSIVTSWGPGLRWGVMGNMMLYHLGGGPGGIENFFQQFAGPIDDSVEDPRHTGAHSGDPKEARRQRACRSRIAHHQGARSREG
jgi:hypothetical protein